MKLFINFPLFLHCSQRDNLYSIIRTLLPDRQTQIKKLLSIQNACIDGVLLHCVFVVRCGNIFANLVGR